MAGTELRLRDQIIETHRALHQQEVANKTDLKKQRIKDSRNLYLVKEGGKMMLYFIMLYKNVILYKEML